MTEKRKPISKELREQVWKLVSGRCHICGKKIRKNAKHGEYGRWHVGHVLAHKMGGSAKFGNLLPTCRECNLTLKHSGSHRIKRILRIGVWGENEIKSGTELGKQLAIMYRKRKLMRIKNRVGVFERLK